MSGKVKMRCAHCGKTFKSNGKQTLCDECEAKDRAARAAGKGAVAKPTTVAQPIQKPRITGAGARILDPSLPEMPDPTLAPPPREHPASSHERDAQLATSAAPQASRPPSAPSTAPAQRNARPARLTTPKAAAPKKERPAKIPRPPREPQGLVELSPDQRATVEARYLALATPVEFDGIRTQIAAELSLPKSAVKKAVAELRQRMQMPSWWELQAYTGTEEDLERVRQAYLPLLPLPEVGAHKRISADLGLEQTVVYQAIRRIRAELRLPQYNARESATVRAAAQTN